MDENTHRQKDEEVVHVLEQDEIRSLMINFLKTRGSPGATAEEIDKVLEWALEAKVQWLLVELVKIGDLGVDLDETGEIVFRAGNLTCENVN